jgi:hypothetical protein
MTSNMNKLLFAAALALPALAVGTTRAAAQPSPTLLIVHGIEGSDLGPDFLPTLPINVSLDGKCLTGAGESFGAVLGPYPVSVGHHKVVISLANPLKPCSNAAVISTTAGLTAGQQYAIVAEESSAGPVAAFVDLTEQTPVPLGAARAVIFHAANAPAVDVTLTDVKGKTVQTFSDIAPGSRVSGDIAPFASLSADVLPTGTSTVVAGPHTFSAAGRAIELLFIVGDAANGDVTIISKEINGVF